MLVGETGRMVAWSPGKKKKTVLQVAKRRFYL